MMLDTITSHSNGFSLSPFLYFSLTPFESARFLASLLSLFCDKDMK